MKICVKCQKEPALPATPSRPSGYSYCRACSTAKHDEWVQKNPERSKEISRKTYLGSRQERLKLAAQYRKEKRELIKARLSELKAMKRRFVDGLKAGACTDCHGRFPAVAMDFDHVRGTKRAGICVLVDRGYRMEVLLEELKKCELVCSNCHRVRTAQRRLSSSIST